VSAAAPASAAPDVAKAPRMHGGPGSMLFNSARELTDLKDPQKTTLDTIEAAMKDDGPKTEFKDFQAELLSEVKAGKVETAKLDPKVKVIDAAMQTRLDKEADSLTQLHNALEPAQRKALTAIVRDKQTKMEERMNKMKEANAAAPPKPEELAKRRVDRLTKELDLDATQQKSLDGIVSKLAPKMPAPDAMRAEWKKSTDGLLAEFEKDAFDAKKLDFYTQANKKGHAGLQSEVDLMSQLVPVLKQDQRDKLAARLEHPPMMMGMGHMDRGGPGEGRTGFEKHWAGPWQHDEEGPMMPRPTAPQGIAPQAPATTQAPAVPAKP
jgi:hypothetical protein